MVVYSSLVGKEIGKLTILNHLDDNYYLCECSCGNTREVHSSALRGKRPAVASCIDCTKRSVKGTRPPNFVDREGHRYGSLLVVEYLGNSIWKTVCDCGEERLATVPYLLKFPERELACKSCCAKAKAEKTRKAHLGKITGKPANNRSNLVGRVYSNLTVVAFSYSAGKGDRWRAYWECLCVCGVTRIAHTGALNSGLATSCGCMNPKPWTAESKITLGAHLRSIPEYTNWRVSVLERDNYVCQGCNKYGGAMDAHHIVYWQNLLQLLDVQPLDDFSSYNVLWDVRNGVTLCRQCHKSIHSPKGQLTQMTLIGTHLRAQTGFLDNLKSMLSKDKVKVKDQKTFQLILDNLKNPYEINFLVSYLKKQKQFYPIKVKLNHEQ